METLKKWPGQGTGPRKDGAGSYQKRLHELEPSTGGPVETWRPGGLVGRNSAHCASAAEGGESSAQLRSFLLSPPQTLRWFAAGAPV